MQGSRLQRWLREPLLHFIALGAGVFVITSNSDAPTVPPDGVEREIVVTAEMVEGLRQDWVRRSGLPPSTEEEERLVHQLVVEEALYREARLLGLDRGDPIVRRRLVQKMRFLMEDTSQVAPPSDADLAALLNEEAQRYQRPARVSFEHVFVSRQRHPDDAEARAAELLRTLETAPETAADLGDPYLHGRAWTLAEEDSISGLFGRAFAAALLDVETGRWSGPISSAYGLHLVRVHANEPRRPLALDEAREDLTDEWERRRQAEATQALVDRVVQSYSVRVEPLPAAEPGRLSQQVGP